MINFVKHQHRPGPETCPLPSPKTLSRNRALAFLSLLFAASCLTARGQIKTELVNDEGATAPCVGIGPIGGPAARKCAELFEQAGFLKAEAVGLTGLSIGTSEKDDGVITRVDPGSPAAQGGLVVGDVVLAIDGSPVKPTPGSVATRWMFGKKGEMLALTVRRAGMDKVVSLVRGPEPPPPNAPKSPSFFISVKPLVDWRGHFVPCLGMGPAAMAAIAYCDSHFKPFGFVKVGERGSTGLNVNLEDASVTAVDPDSPAAHAEIKLGDAIVAVDGKPLVGSAGEVATQRLFGKAGEQRRVTVHSGDADKVIALTLAAKAKN